MSLSTATVGLRESLGIGSRSKGERPEGSPRESASTDNRRAALNVPESLISALKQRVENLQMLPAVAAQALELAKDPDCPMSRFSSVVERDLKLASDILRMANSSAFSTGSSVASLHQAVVRLGLRQCRGLILASSFDSLARKLGHEDQRLRNSLSRHGFLTAIIALRLNHLFGLGLQGEEFTAGLMHDLGRILLAVAMPEEFRNSDPLSFHEGDDLEATERELFGASHAEFGAWFALENKLPESLVAAIRFHHAPNEAGDNRRIAAITAAADHLATFIQRNDGEKYDPQSNPGVAVLQGLGIATAQSKFLAAAETLVFECPRVADAMMKE